MNRNIFTYNNGKREVKADPLEIDLRWAEACSKTDVKSIMDRFNGPPWYADPSLIKDGKYRGAEITDEMFAFASRQNREAMQELIPLICEMFGVKTVRDDEENGMTYAELLAAFGEYWTYVDSLKKNTDASAERPPHSGESPDSSTTNNSADTITIPI